MKIIGPPDGNGGGIVRISPPDGTRVVEIERDITMIVTMSRNLCIGKNNKTPWPPIPKNTEHFRRITEGNVVVVGRITDEIILKKFKDGLPNRDTIVITYNPKSVAPRKHCSVVSKNVVAQVLAMARKRKVFIAGGEKIYKLFLPNINRLVINQIEVFADGDAFFPKIGREWSQIYSNHYLGSLEKKTPAFSINTYVRLPRP